MSSYDDAKKVIKFLKENYSTYHCGIGLTNHLEGEERIFSVSFRYYDVLPKDFPLEINNIKIITEKRNRYCIPYI